MCEQDGSCCGKSERCEIMCREFHDAEDTVEFNEGADRNAVMKDVVHNCKKVESDCEIYL